MLEALVHYTQAFNMLRRESGLVTRTFRYCKSIFHFQIDALKPHDTFARDTRDPCQRISTILLIQAY